MTDDLWPDNISLKTSLKAPVTILKEQGTLLGRKMNNLVEGVIREVSSDDFRDPLSEDINYFMYRFYIAAPALGDYRYRLLTISHSIDLYPLDITVDESVLEELPDDVVLNNMDNLVVSSQEEFIEILRAIFATKKVRKVIEAIIAQSG